MQRIATPVTTPSELKTILHSKRANLYYLQHCRVLVNDGRVEYITDEGSKSRYWNIPIANTTSIMLGTGTSITQAAVRELAKAGVLLGFSGGSGTPLFAATEVEVDVAWLTSQSEYRPTAYLQHWVSYWFDDDLRLEAAKRLQVARLQMVESHWQKLIDDRRIEFSCDSQQLANVLAKFRQGINQAPNNGHLLAQEAVLTKALYKLAVEAVDYGEFTRAKRGIGIDLANRFLDHGNYLAYGLGATATWVIGLPHGLAVMHGKTRRGGLVFDAADVIKDALVLPQAFISAMTGETEQEFRQRCVQRFHKANALDVIIEQLQTIAIDLSTISTPPHVSSEETGL